MSGKVLYRKYRPTQLQDVVGQAQVTAALANAIKKGKIGHAYLFIGPRGTGKTSVARIFAHAVNGFDYQVEDNYIDIIEIDAASNTGVDNIRELREKAVIAPTTGKYKVYIIDEVHMLTKSASNALLKTLEEPPEHVIFIMATTDAHKVPVTISSRTQVFTFKLADAETMFQHLQKIAQKEQIKITDEALKLVVRRGGGSFRDSLSLLDQITNLTTSEITAEVLSQALGLPQDQTIKELLENYAAGNKNQIQQLLKDLLNTGIKPEIIATELIDRIIEQPETAWLDLLAKLPEVQPPFPEAKLLLALLSKVPRESSGSEVIKATAEAQEVKRPSAKIPTKTTVKVKPLKAEEAAQDPGTAAEATQDPGIDEEITPTLEATDAPIIAGANSESIEAPQATGEIANADAGQEETSAETGTPTVFDWETLLENVHQDSDAVFLQLQKTTYKLVGDTLHLYPANKFAKSILAKAHNSQIIASHLGGLALSLHEVGEKHAPEDATLSQISAIMGDVQEVNGEMPF